MRTKEQILKRLRTEGLHLATVSGVLTTRPGMIEWVDRMVPEIDIITTKSYQVRPNPGYREPILLEKEAGCFANAVGLRNPGMAAGFQELSALRRRHSLRSLLNVSLSANSVEDFSQLARCFAPVADILELNFSCPHAASGYGSSIGTDPRLVHEYVCAIRQVTSAPLFAKLTPNVPNIGDIARAAVSAGADGLSAINTVGPELFRDPGSGKPILSNPNGGKGGKSGEWIKERALQSVAEIRGAIGPDIPILGIGGVSSGEDIRRMKKAGANMVGLGSVFARVPRQDLIPLYVGALKKDLVEGGNTASTFLATERLMAYRTSWIREIRGFGETLRMITLEGNLSAATSQYAFLFLPGTGEKPFSLASCEPATFLVRRRGPFTEALFRMRVGDPILVRGPYGAQIPESDKPNAIILAGGTGIALAPLLVEKFLSQGKEVTLLFGSSREDDLGILSTLNLPCRLIAVPDQGQPARILTCLPDHLDQHSVRECCFYNVGPQGFLARSCRRERALGAAATEIYLSLETPSLCGVGLCGSCECGGRLLCKEGTFVSLQYLSNHGLSPETFPDQVSDTVTTVAEQPKATVLNS
ncbi:MAG: dihydroorotate dehydrogenase [Spirochaetaceae bacterium]|nr:MAG: dihydroorotate dehydrogenase [Spirochaetaceae bacterium]